MLCCLFGRRRGDSRGAVPGRAVLCQPQRALLGQPRFFWGKDEVAGDAGETYPRSDMCAPRGVLSSLRCVTVGVLRDVSLALPALAGCWRGEGVREAGEGRVVLPLAAPRCRIHPRCCRRRAGHITLRCQDNGNSYTLLFILKDTCSYLLLQSPQKIACHAKFLRGNRTRCFCRWRHLLGTCQLVWWLGGHSWGDSPLLDGTLVGG